MQKLNLFKIITVLCFSFHGVGILAGKIIHDSDDISDSGDEGSDSDSDFSEESDFESAVKRNRGENSDEEAVDHREPKRPRIDPETSPSSSSTDAMVLDTDSDDVVESAVDGVPCEIWQEILRLVGPLDRNHMRLVCGMTRRAVDRIRIHDGLTDRLPVVRTIGGFGGHFAPVFLNGRMFVVNRETATLMVFDAQTLQPIATIQLPELPGAPTATTDGRLVVPHPHEMDVTLIDINTLEQADRATYAVAPGTTGRDQMALFVTALTDFHEIATLPMLHRAPLTGRIGPYEVRLNHVGAVRTTMTLALPGPRGFRATFNFAFGTLLPVLFGYYLFIAEPMSGNMVVIDFRGHL